MLIPPSLFLPPLECCFGTSPIQAEKFRPDRKAFGSATVAARAVANAGPMPGQSSSRKLISLDRCQALIMRSNSKTEGPVHTEITIELDAPASAGSPPISKKLKTKKSVFPTTIHQQIPQPHHNTGPKKILRLTFRRRRYSVFFEVRADLAWVARCMSGGGCCSPAIAHQTPT